MSDQSRFSEKVNAILEMEKAWGKEWKHKNPLCKEWQEHLRIYGYGFCKHYAEARTEQFKEAILDLWDITKWDGKLYNWVYISNK